MIEQIHATKFGPTTSRPPAMQSDREAERRARNGLMAAGATILLLATLLTGSIVVFVGQM